MTDDMKAIICELLKFIFFGHSICYIDYIHWHPSTGTYPGKLLDRTHPGSIVSHFHAPFPLQDQTRKNFRLIPCSWSASLYVNQGRGCAFRQHLSRRMEAHRHTRCDFVYSFGPKGWCKSRLSTHKKLFQYSGLSLVAGLIIVLVVSRIIGMRFMVQIISGPHFHQSIKSFLEEGTELLGYIIIFTSSLSYCLVPEIKFSFLSSLLKPLKNSTSDADCAKGRWQAAFCYIFMNACNQSLPNKSLV